MIREVLCQNHVDLLCIQETKSQSIDRRLCAQLWGDSEFSWKAIPAVNRGGGLLCVWKLTTFVLQDCVEGPGFLGLIGSWNNSQQLCVIVNIYSSGSLEEKLVTWNALREWRRNCTILPWCIAGDFNAVRCVEERRGISGVLSSQRRDMEEFNSFISEMNLDDVLLAGKKFTWFRPNNQAQSRIDRFLTSAEWNELWPHCSQLVLDRSISDHCPLLLRQRCDNWGPMPFRVLNCWLEDPRLTAVVSKSWADCKVSGWGAFILKEKLKNLRFNLREWNSSVFGNLKVRRDALVQQINSLDAKQVDGGLSDAEKLQHSELSTEFWSVLRLQESLLCQKARLKWISEGDQNTHFFHSTINWKRKSNSVVGLLIDGLWSEDPDQVKSEVQRFFAQKFKTDSWCRPTLDGVNFNSLSEVDNQTLTAPISEGELKEAVWSCGGDKSPGPDGFNFRFIQKFWNFMKDDFFKMAKEFWRRGAWPRGVNASFIALIPKVNSPFNLNDFRPISLISCIYKVISKLLAIRLKSVLGRLIDERQFAFIGGRSMLDSVVVVNEIVHEAKTRKRPTIIFKVDYEKAYDSVEWSFLLYMLQRMNFHSKWLLWIKSCLESASVSVLVNGSPTGEFKMERGLRQGDPLAPFLFLIVAEGLNILFLNSVHLSIFSGYKVGGSDNCLVSLLQFADDTIFLGEASVQNVIVIKAVLRCFEMVSGLKVNFFKSKLAGLSIAESLAGRFASILNCKLMSIPFVYLGIPIGGRPDRLSTWEPVINKFRSRLSVWRRKSVSFGGRICLIQSVLSALPLFFLSFFRMPPCVMKICIRLMRNFLWGGDGTARKIAWVKWSSVCQSKEAGGLGVKDLDLFNRALLGKWVWSWRREPTALWCRVIQAKYGDNSFNKSSVWWRDIHRACIKDSLNWFEEGSTKSVRGGDATKLWHEDWLGHGCLREKFLRLYNLSNQRWVRISDCGVWVGGVWEWNLRWRRPLRGRELGWEQSLLQELRSITLREGCPDLWSWNVAADGIYSVNSAYFFLQEQAQTALDPCFSALWKTFCSSNVKAFTWRLLLDRIASKENLLKRHILVSVNDAPCALCQDQLETCFHLIFSCSFSVGIWQSCCLWLGIQFFSATSAREHFLAFRIGRSNVHQRMGHTVWMIIAWSLWLIRNEVTFRAGSADVDSVLELIKRRSWLWINANLTSFQYPFAVWSHTPLSCILSS